MTPPRRRSARLAIPKEVNRVQCPLTTNVSQWDNRWWRLPQEIRCLILDELLRDSAKAQPGGHSLARLATVSREWQSTIEHHNFSRIKLTPSCLKDASSMLQRNRSLVRYIYYCVELKEYDCTECAKENHYIDVNDGVVLVAALEDLFSYLNTWIPDDNLVLDISVYSPSDAEHRFKYLTFEPDSDHDEMSRQRIEQSIQAKSGDPVHGWHAGHQQTLPTYQEINRLFEEIHLDSALWATTGDQWPESNQEEAWWKHGLPAAPAVTSLLLRLQSRRRWRTENLKYMLALLPELQEFHYEAWAEWDSMQQEFADERFTTLLESLNSGRLRRLVLFQNSNHAFMDIFDAVPDEFDEHRVQTVILLNQALVRASLNLEQLSVTYLVDADSFFAYGRPSYEWPNLTRLALTSQLLLPWIDRTDVINMLTKAAEAALKMPKLQTMEIWYGDKGSAMLFRYQRPETQRYAEITWRGTWDLAVRPPTIKAWDAVVKKHGGNEHRVVKELVDIKGEDIKSHADAIRCLNLKQTVVRPVSLWQIDLEHRMIEGAVNQ